MKHLFITLLIISFFSTNAFAKNDPNNNSFLNSNQRSKAAKANDTLHYTFEIENSLKVEQFFNVFIKKPRELACKTILLDTIVSIKPNQVYKGELSIIVSDRIPLGGQESSYLVVENKVEKRIETLEFISVRYKPHPFLLVTNEIIEETKSKAKNVDWANRNLEELISFSKKYEVPERKIVLKARNTREWKSLAYSASDSEKAFKVALAYKLTGNKEFLNKVVRFVTEVCNPEKGYLSIGAATVGVQVHEGNFFLYLASICDILYGEDANVLSKTDRENIEKTLRYYLHQDKAHMDSIGIMNHQASANAGAILVSLFLQDIVAVNHLVESDGGLIDQMTKGVMADGWWFEGTPGYCYLVTQRFCVVAQAFENYGWNLYDKEFPAKYKSKDFVNAKEGYTGMKFDIWGPTGSNTRGLHDMCMAYIPMMDENANLVASNDGTLASPSVFYEFAYRHYKNKELAWVISKTKREGWESLLYGVENLPKVDDPRFESDFVSNVGLVALRSQTKNRSKDEQIQTYFKFGTHGGWHGHLDRTGMVALDRYGHKYFGTEMVWFGYGHAGYKECVQTSATHNMVVVDELQQEAVPSEQILFHKGHMMQATVVQTNARWRPIPIFNNELFPPWNDFDFDSKFTPILQRRLSIVTDDYVVVADYMKGNQEHTYDWMIHPIGVKSIDGAKEKGTIMPKLSEDSNSPYKYFTNAQWYKSNNRAKVMFQDGDMKLDIHTIYPKKADLVLAKYPNGGKRRRMRNNPDRATYGIRLQGEEAMFLNVIEPYKGKTVIEKIESKSSKELVVFLTDGRKQIISIDNFKENNIKISIKEFINNRLVRTEKTEE